MSLGALPPSIRTAIPGPQSRAWTDRLAKSECPALTMRRARRAEQSGASTDPIVYARALGANVVDVDDNVYVDLCAGFSVAALGHAHPAVVEAITQQAQHLPHALGDVYPSTVKLELMEALLSWVDFDARVILGLNGSDAVAAALKTAVLATSKPGVLAFDPGYHGLMYGPLAACGYADAFRAPFEAQLNPHVVFAPYPRANADVALAEVDALWNANIGAVLVEPALGRGGLRFAPAGFLEGLAERCRARGAVLILDEIFTGFGRTGARWAHDSGVTPDLLCVGKALGGELPVSACIGREPVMRAWGNPDQIPIHTATFAGHPLGCAAALAALRTIESDGLVERSLAVGQRWLSGLRTASRSLSCVREVRGRGLMVGVELDSRARALATASQLLERGYLVLTAGPAGDVLQLTPPLTIEEDLLHSFTDTLVELLR